ncbi:MAG: hypothetical protein ACTSRA_06565 [Promethearchaeota archaeon]
MSQTGKEVTIKVTCPCCGQQEEFKAPVDQIKNNLKGILTVSLKAKCGHSYHVFIDKNFMVRGYQRCDYDIKLDVPTIEEKEQVTEDLSLQGIIRLFGEDAFIYSIHAMLLGMKVILLGSDQQILKTLFYNYISIFEREISKEAEVIEIMSKEEFKEIDEFQFKDCLIIDIDFSAIKSNPLLGHKIKGERELVKASLNLDSIAAQKADLKERISRVFLYIDIIGNLIKSGHNTLKEIKKLMKQKQENVSMKEVALAFSIAQHNA